MKYYALAKKISQTYGHGDRGDEYHICPKDAYHTNSTEFHPIFETEEEAKKYMRKIDRFERFTIVELEIYSNGNKT